MDHGGACVILEKDSSGKVLFEKTAAILHDPERHSAMSRAMADLGIPDATERICSTILSIGR